MHTYYFPQVGSIVDNFYQDYKILLFYLAIVYQLNDVIALCEHITVLC